MSECSCTVGNSLMFFLEIGSTLTGGGVMGLVMACVAWIGGLQFCFEVFVVAFCFVIVIMGATFIGWVRDVCFLSKGQRCGCV